MPSGYGYLPRGTFEDPVAAKVIAKRDNRKPDPAAGERYAAQLALETDRTLWHSPNWRAGRPLDDHSTRCDCPPLRDCVERWGTT